MPQLKIDRGTPSHIDARWPEKQKYTKEQQQHKNTIFPHISTPFFVFSSFYSFFKFTFFFTLYSVCIIFFLSSFIRSKFQNSTLLFRLVITPRAIDPKCSQSNPTCRSCLFSDARQKISADASAICDVIGHDVVYVKVLSRVRN